MFYRQLGLIVIVFAALISQANSAWGLMTQSIAAITENTQALSDNDIVRLSKLSDEVKGTQKVGKELGELNLPNDVLEDAFLRIAIYQEKLDRQTAEGMFARLTGVPGFRATLRKIIGNNRAVTIGHLNELRIAESAVTNGFKVLGIGEKFNDGLKKGATDIDLLLNKKDRLFAIEAKNYASTTKIRLDRFRADLDTLVAYKNANSNHVVLFCTITNKPDNLSYLQALQSETDKRGIQLIFGLPQAQIEQIKMFDNASRRHANTDHPHYIIWIVVLGVALVLGIIGFVFIKNKTRTPTLLKPTA
ncbi:hypothetical protein [Thiospirillum jenense]|uniref:Uncharacterized protein n=1 Tax=Thiospirillum jenense TaxID=1653858 RepID=A0A839H9A1_9GAMM|nr:hypothetical protein [Thiospirillum jenense]MBB1125621.1 hypothetical protein [Thiospirillum jenense]